MPSASPTFLRHGRKAGARHGTHPATGSAAARGTRGSGESKDVASWCEQQGREEGTEGTEQTEGPVDWICMVWVLNHRKRRVFVAGLQASS